MRTGEIAVVAVLAVIGVVLLVQLSKQSAMERALLAQSRALEALAGEMTGARAEARAQAEAAETEEAPLDEFTAAALLLSHAPNPEIRSNAAEILGELGGDQAAERLVQLGREDPACRWAVLDALRNYDGPKATQTLVDLIREGKLDQRRSAADDLDEIITPAMVPAVGELLSQLTFSNEDTNRHIRRSIYAALKKLGEPAACKPLLTALRRETDDGQRRYVLEAMSACTTRNSVLVLCDALNSIPVPSKGDDGYVYHSLVRTIGQARDPRATEYLLPLLRAADPKLVRTVVEALCTIRDPLAAKALCELASTDNEVRKAREQNLRKGYPGVREENGKFLPLPQDQLTPLLENRKRFIQSIETAVNAE